jgi:hypothetical protein
MIGVVAKPEMAERFTRRNSPTSGMRGDLSAAIRNDFLRLKARPQKLLRRQIVAVDIAFAMRALRRTH